MLIGCETESIVRVEQLLAGKRVYHATPLHYLPSILAGWELLSSTIGARRGIAPRKGAHRRDRMLGVDRYVHFALEPVTPLVEDKLRRGMPHVVLSLDALSLFRQRPKSCSLLSQNTKAWRSRACLKPIADLDEIASILLRRERYGRFPSLEFLVDGRIDLASLDGLIVFSERELEAARLVARAFARRDVALTLLPSPVGTRLRDEAGETFDYIDRCVWAKSALPAPVIAFD
jgi:hypothetical protein